MRLHVVGPGLEDAVPDEGTASDDGTASADGTPAADRISLDHPSIDRLHGSRFAPPRPVGGAGGPGTSEEGSTRLRITTSARTTPTVSSIGGPIGYRRPTAYQSGLAAVARHEVHIERVWPMRSPSTGPLEESSSAYFQSERRGTPPAGILPVGGLRMSQAFPHQPVMASEVIALFRPVAPGLIVDATLGGGGHAAGLLGAQPGITVLGIDRDPLAVAAARESLAPFGARAIIRRSRFDAMADVVHAVQAELGTVEDDGLSGVLFDLGVSSPQLDVAERGFSYRRDAPLDMRMDPTSGRTAADVVNGFDEDALVELFTDNGEGRFARRIARAIMVARPIATTGQLADVVRAAIPAATRRSGGHPARRVFQAVRMAVNEELEQLRIALDSSLDLLRPGGRCVVIAYHSGEDRLVKSTFSRAATGNCQCPPGLPCVCGADPQFRLVVRGARRPTQDEIDRNRRSEAARLRVIERLPRSANPSSNTGEVA